MSVYRTIGPLVCGLVPGSMKVPSRSRPVCPGITMVMSGVTPVDHDGIPKCLRELNFHENS